MIVDPPPLAQEFARRIEHTAIALFFAVPVFVGACYSLFSGVAARVVPGGPYYYPAYVVEVTAYWTVAHLHLLALIVAKRLACREPRTMLPPGTILVVNDDDGETWGLFIHATAVMIVGLLAWVNSEHLDVAALVLVSAVFLHRLIVITVLWFRVIGALGASVGVLSREAAQTSGYRQPGRLVLHAAGVDREVVLERVDATLLHLRYVGTAALAGQEKGPKFESKGGVWRAAGGLEGVNAWLEEVGACR